MRVYVMCYNVLYIPVFFQVYCYCNVLIYKCANLYCSICWHLHQSSQVVASAKPKVRKNPSHIRMPVRRKFYLDETTWKIIKGCFLHLWWLDWCMGMCTYSMKLVDPETWSRVCLHEKDQCIALQIRHNKAAYKDGQNPWDIAKLVKQKLLVASQLLETFYIQKATGLSCPKKVRIQRQLTKLYMYRSSQYGHSGPGRKLPSPEAFQGILRRTGNICHGSKLCCPCSLPPCCSWAFGNAALPWDG